MEKKGAEATVKSRDGKIIKERVEKKYRHPSLDWKIREKRTSEELKNIRRARKYNVNAPETEKTSETVLEQEEIDGKILKNVIGKNPGLMKDVGEQVARMHEADIIHGDLTTSNVLHGEKILLIDFGLSEVSQRAEDKAVDIHLLRQVLDSSHPEVAEESWEKFLEGYQEYGESGKVLERLEEVEKRGRYK